VIDVHGLVAAELELSIDLRAAERLLLLLHAAVPPEGIGNVVFPLFVLKLVNRNLLAFRLHLHRFAELLRHLSQRYRRWNRLAQLNPHECHQTAVDSAPLEPFSYIRSRYSTSSVTCASNNSGMLAMPEILRNSGDLRSPV